jgi:hypothetical protein
MRAYARLLPAVALTLALQAGPRPADAADNSADPEGPGVGPQYDGCARLPRAVGHGALHQEFYCDIRRPSRGAGLDDRDADSEWRALCAGADAGRSALCARIHDANPVSLRLGTGRLSSKRPRRRGRGGCGGRGVAPFADAIGRDAILQWPGGVTMLFYWHNATSAPPLSTIPENRVYVSREKADAFVGSFLRFSKGEVISDSRAADGIEIGRPGETFRRVRIASGFGRLTALVTDGHLPFPFGREIYGYEVGDLTETLAKATAAGATMLVDPFTSDGREAAMVQFPGGYIAEIHTVSPP